MAECICSTTYKSDCVTYTGSTNCIATNGDTLTTVLNNIATTVSPICSTTYDVSCFSGTSETAASIEDAINEIITEICVISGGGAPIYDASCLPGGTATDSIIDVIPLLITVACATGSTFDTTCFSGGSSTESLVNTINRLIASECATTQVTLDWNCLTAPGDDNLDTVLQSILDNIISREYSFDGDLFTVIPASCGSDVTLDIDGLVQELIIDNVFLTAINNYIHENLMYRMFPGDSCGRNYVADSFKFVAPLNATKVSYSLWTYNIQASGLHSVTSLFTGFTMPSGVYYSSGGIAITNTSAIETWFQTNLDIAGVTATYLSNKLTVIVPTHGNSTDARPKIHTKYSSTSTELTWETVSSISTDVNDICNSLKLEVLGLSDPEEEELCTRYEGEDDITVTQLTLLARVWYYTVIDSTTKQLTGHKYDVTTTATASIDLEDESAVQTALDGLSYDGTFTVSYDSGADTTYIEYKEYRNPTDPIPAFQLEIDSVLTNYTSNTEDANDTCDRVTIGRPSAPEDDCPVDVIGTSDVKVDYNEFVETTWLMTHSSFYVGSDTRELQSVTIFNRTYEMPSATILSDVATIQSWLDSLDIGTFTYSFVFVTGVEYIPTFTYTGFTGFGAGYDQYRPSYRIDGFDNPSDFVSSGIDSCSKFVVSLCHEEWTDVPAYDGWDGDLQYRYVQGCAEGLGKVEIKGGAWSKTFSSAQGCKIHEKTFSISLYVTEVNKTHPVFAEYDGNGYEDTNMMYQSGLEQKGGDFYAYFASFYHVPGSGTVQCTNIGSAGSETITLKIPDFYYHAQYYV